MNEKAPNQCSACNREITYKVTKFNYWCPDCFKLFKEAILTNAKWTTVLESSENLRRQRRNKPARFLSLDEMEEKRLREEND